MQPTPLSAQSSPSWWIGPIFNELVIALFPVLTYYAAVSSRLPARVAVHFNEYGMPTRFEDKNSMDALLGFIGLGILGFLIGKILRLIILCPFTSAGMKTTGGLARRWPRTRNSSWSSCLPIFA